MKFMNLAVLATTVSHAFAFSTPGATKAFHRPATSLAGAGITTIVTDDYSSDQGAMIAPTTVQEIPLSVEEFWSGFDDYLGLQQNLSGHGDTWLHLGAGRPNNGVGAEIHTEFDGSVTKEVLWQKDDLNHIWVMGIPEANHIFKYYRCTVSCWDGPNGKARAKLTIDGALTAETPEERKESSDLMDHYIPERIPEICQWVLRRDGLRSRMDVELNCPAEEMWDVVSDWSDISWVQYATGVEDLGDDVRRITFSNGNTLDERLDSTDEESKTLVYTVLDSQMPVKMYEGTVEITKIDDKKCMLSYSNVYIAKGDDPEAVKAMLDADFEQRKVWMQETFDQSQGRKEGFIRCDKKRRIQKILSILS